MQIEENQLSAVLRAQQRLVEAERKRLESLTEADVRASFRGNILNVGAVPGRHVNAGDAIASLVDCDKRFVVAIFSYRQGQTMEVGTHVRVDGGTFGSGVVAAVLPRTSDKIDERFAVPFPQTERRELYDIIVPERTDGHRTDVAVGPAPAALDGQSAPCAVGQWVTVTKDNAIVPSMSVTWRRLETLVTSWGHDMGPLPSDKGNQQKGREAGTAILADKLRADPEAARGRTGMENWTPRTDAVVVSR